MSGQQFEWDVTDPAEIVKALDVLKSDALRLHHKIQRWQFYILSQEQTQAVGFWTILETSEDDRETTLYPKLYASLDAAKDAVRRDLEDSFEGDEVPPLEWADRIEGGVMRSSRCSPFEFAVYEITRMEVQP